VEHWEDAIDEHRLHGGKFLLGPVS